MPLRTTKSTRAQAACPLCGGHCTVTTRRIATEPIAHHWKSLGYDLATAFANFPELLDKRLCLDCDLRFYEPQLIGGPDLYRVLGGTSGYYAAEKWEFIEVLKLLAARPRGGALLEYGCGNGSFLERTLPFFDRAVGVDFNQDSVKEGQARGLHVVDADIATLSETFDVVVSFQVLEHVRCPGETLAHLSRLLRPGGALIVAVPNNESLLDQMDYNYLNLPPHHASCWTRKTFSYVERLLSVTMESYLREPLSIDLYLGALHERFDRYLSARTLLMRPWLWFIRRTAIAFALTNFDSITAGLPGHTHIAVFRKPEGAPGEAALSA